MTELAPDPAATLRPPDTVMRLSRLGSLHQCRLSFMRQLTRRMAAENWRVRCTDWSVDGRGIGHAIYTAWGPDRAYSLVAFAHDLPDEMRSDRVIAEAWDATFVLFDGVPGPADIARLARNVPLQEAGRISGRELTLSRANRSARLWAETVASLARGAQPDPARLADVGYLMRTTAVYGSGKFGAADREAIAGRPEFAAPFQAEMLTVYLIRIFVRDLVDHMARAAGGTAAARLDPALARQLGIGNSTGLGMAPFIVNHPVLFNNWIVARETAIARVRAVARADAAAAALFRDLLARTRAMVALWQSDSPHMAPRIDALARDLAAVDDRIGAFDFAAPYPWDRLMREAEVGHGEEAQECLASLILEPYPALVDDLADTMAGPSPGLRPLDGRMRVAALRADIAARYGWALATDWTETDAQARIWYVSAEKLEPRLGQRFEEDLDAYEEPLAAGRDIAALHAALEQDEEGATVSEFLMRHPEHRHSVRRVQVTRDAPYAEIRDNIVGAGFLPIDMLRAKLSFFGATGFDPRSDRWVRICMFAGAPFPEDLTPGTADLWVYRGAASGGA